MTLAFKTYILRRILIKDESTINRNLVHVFLLQNQIIAEARNLGFKRIGVGRTFVHLGIDESKSQFVAWGYPSGSRPDVNPFV